MPLLQKLTEQKTEQMRDSLSAIWAVDGDKVSEYAEQLIEIGFFQRRGSREDATFWVPFLYRDALNMIQGLAEEN